MPRTYDSPIVADTTIAHIAVPVVIADKFSEAQRETKTYCSDHVPIWTIWRP